jgi:hypothetical protein
MTSGTGKMNFGRTWSKLDYKMRIVCNVLRLIDEIGGTDFGRTEFGRIPILSKPDFGRTGLWVERNLIEYYF